MRTIVILATLLSVVTHPAHSGAAQRGIVPVADSFDSGGFDDFPPMPAAGLPTAPYPGVPAPAPGAAIPGTASPMTASANPGGGPSLPSTRSTNVAHHVHVDTSAVDAPLVLPNDCGVLVGYESWDVRNQLTSYKDVFGKNALDWSEADYRRAIGLAKSCHGTNVGKVTVDGNNWAAMIEFAFRNVLPIAIVARKVDEYGAELRASEAAFPRCPKLLEFKHDDWQSSDNSKAIFGVDFMKMSDDDLNKSVLYANECLLYLPTYALAAKQIRQNETTEILNAVMDRALLVVKRRQDYADDNEWPKRDTDLVLTEENGAPIMPTLTSAAAREMIQRFDRAAASRRKFTPETVATLVRLSDEVLTANKSAFDKQYATAVQRKVQEMIFRRGD